MTVNPKIASVLRTNSKQQQNLTKLMQTRFPNSTVEYNTDGYWDVTVDDGSAKIVKSYVLKEGNLVHFATLTMED